MGWNQIRKNCRNNKHGLSIAHSDIDVFFLGNLETHTWDRRTEYCYLHNNIGSNSQKKPAIVYLYPTASAKCNFQKPDIVFCSSRTRCWIKSIVSTLRFYLFILLCGWLAGWLSFGSERRCKIWGLSNFQHSALLMSFSNTSLTSASGSAASARAGKGAMRFWKWFMRSKINDAAWPACKVQPLNGSVAD